MNQGAAEDGEIVPAAVGHGRDELGDGIEVAELGACGGEKEDMEGSFDVFACAELKRSSVGVDGWVVARHERKSLVSRRA